MPDTAAHRIRHRTTLFVVSAIFEAFSGPLVAKVVRYVCDSLSILVVSVVRSPDNSRTNRTVMPAKPSPVPDVARVLEPGADDAGWIGTHAEPDTHDVPRPDRSPECHSRARPPDDASLGLKISRSCLALYALYPVPSQVPASSNRYSRAPALSDALPERSGL